MAAGGNGHREVAASGTQTIAAGAGLGSQLLAGWQIAEGWFVMAAESLAAPSG
jgi:hypothetical protein